MYAPYSNASVIYFCSVSFSSLALSKISEKPSVSNLYVSNIIVLFVRLFVALDILHFNKAVTSILAGAVAIFIVLGYAF